MLAPELMLFGTVLAKHSGETFQNQYTDFPARHTGKDKLLHPF